jgi:hypothetical protein
MKQNAAVELRQITKDAIMGIHTIEETDRILKQWEDKYSSHPRKRLADCLRIVAARMMISDADPSPQNIPYYMDQEVPEGYEGILESLHGLYDNDNAVRFDISRQGERPDKDINNDLGDFSAPKDPIMTDVKPRGDGADPDGLESPDAPGGDLDGLQDLQ